MANRRTFRDAWHDLREVLGLSFPVIVAMASHTLMGFVDALLLAWYGANELAAVGAAASASFAIVAFVMGTASCAGTFVAQSVGRGEPAEAARYTWQGVYFGFVCQALVVPVLLAAPAFFALFRHGPQVQALEAEYFQIRLLHLAGTAAYASLSSFFQGISRPGITMWAAIIANLFNAVGDCVLIFGLYGFPEMGIRGAAWATVASSYVQVVCLLVPYLWRATHEVYRTRAGWRLDGARLRRLLRIGWPAGVSFMLDVASWSLFTLALIGRQGRDVLAAHNVVGQVIGLSFMPAVGIHKGVQVLVGQYVGRRDIPAAKRLAYTGLAVAMVYMALMGVAFALFRGPVVRVFRDEPAIVSAGGTMLLLAALFQAFDAVGIVCVGALRGAGDTRVPALIGIGLAWGVLLPLGTVLTFVVGWGYVGAWLAAAIEIALYGLLMFRRFAGEAWRKIDIFE
jgi:MATE family multidrug resistance protein